MMCRILFFFAIALAASCALCLAPGALAGFSVDQEPTEFILDPGDFFLPGAPPVCEIDDGDSTCSTPVFLAVPDPGVFDLDALTLDAPLEVCPDQPTWPPGILFSLDDGDPGPGGVPPDRSTEILFYDHCAAGGSFYTTITESFLGLGLDPPPPGNDDDVDAYETRDAVEHWGQLGAVLFSSDSDADGGLVSSTIYTVDSMSGAALDWATAVDLGVPNPAECDIDGIARFLDPAQPEWLVLFTTDLAEPCGLDPGDLYVSDAMGNLALYADDVWDLKIALSELDPVDVDAIAINTDGNVGILFPFDPTSPDDYKAGWTNRAPSGMPDLCQDHAQWPTTWCGPSAVADALWWLDSEMECERDREQGEPLELEPNDAWDQANLLGEIDPIPGSFPMAADIEDWYVFEVPYVPRVPDCTVTVSTCALRLPTDVDTRLTLYGPGTGTGPGSFVADSDDFCLPDLQSEIELPLEGGRYFVRLENSGGAPGIDYTLSLGIDCYPMVNRYPDIADDHATHNPRPLMTDLAACMNTDNQTGTGVPHLGTELPEMELCLHQWLAARQLDDDYSVLVALGPPFDEVAVPVERSEVVVLLLGFWWTPDGGATWSRCGGHFVAASGADNAARTIWFSDPAINNAEPPTGGPGRVLGPDHVDHAPAVNPPPDHDDPLNLSHDRYVEGPTRVPAVSMWSVASYATSGSPTTCSDVARFCMSDEWGQNPPEPPQPQEPCLDGGLEVSVEVEALVGLAPPQTPVCVLFDSFGVLRMERNPCSGALTTVSRDVIRGKLCNLRMNPAAPEVDLGSVHCLYDDAVADRFDDLCPDRNDCFGGWFYLARDSGDPDYGPAEPGGEPRLPGPGTCP